MGDLEGLETEHLLSLYRRMLLIRMFEDRVYYLFLQGEIAGTVHQYQGQEGVAVGVCDHLSHSDWITSTHRPHGHALAKGVSSRAAMAELYAKATGCCGGKGGSMHLGDPAERASAYGVTAQIVDGMDVLAVHTATGAALEQIRAGDGPILLECKT